MSGTSKLEFSTFIDDRTKDFTGREWVFRVVETWLASPDGPLLFSAYWRAGQRQNGGGRAAGADEPGAGRRDAVCAPGHQTARVWRMADGRP